MICIILGCSVAWFGEETKNGKERNQISVKEERKFKETKDCFLFVFREHRHVSTELLQIWTYLVLPRAGGRREIYASLQLFPPNQAMKHSNNVYPPVNLWGVVSLSNTIRRRRCDYGKYVLFNWIDLSDEVIM